jgi:GMP synthase-like glutamine amidotransferase
MKIGILNSDTVEIEGTDEFGQYPEMFFKVFGRVNPKVAFKTYEVQMNNLPDDLHECDAYLITGSKASAYEDIPWINNLKKFIQKAR